MASQDINQSARFITFEGGEGSGKTTQLKRLAERLRKIGADVLETREPGGSEKAESIRQYLLSGQAEGLGAKAEALLFAAARMDHLEQVIRSALKAGRWVLCDRFMDSTRVYQGLCLEPAFIDFLEKVAVQNTKPGLTLLLDIPAEKGLARISERDKEKDRFEKAPLETHERQRQAFLKLAEAEPERFLVVDAAKTPEKVEKEIWEGVRAHFSL